MLMTGIITSRGTLVPLYPTYNSYIREMYIPYMYVRGLEDPRTHFSTSQDMGPLAHALCCLLY